MLSTSAAHAPLTSLRLRDLAPSATLLVNERVNQLWAEGKKVYHLGFGESRFPVHPKLEEALKANAHRKSYLSSLGLPELREKIAQFYQTHFGIHATPAQVVVGPGSKALIYALMLALDGELILPTPSWVSYQAQARLVGKPVNWLLSSPANRQVIDLEALEQVVEKIRWRGGTPGAILLNSPNNPSGQMLAPEAARQLADYCRSQGLTVISDEIYGLIAHEPTSHYSIAREYPEGTIVLGGLSKHLSLGGWRLGVAIAPDTPWGKQLVQTLRMLASELWSAATAPVQYAALVAYSEAPDLSAYISECTQIHGLRTHYLWQQLTEMGIDCPQPQGGFYLFPNFDRWREQLQEKGIQTSSALASYLLEEYQLATLPGSHFGTPPEELSLRLSSSYLDLETDEKASQLLDTYRTERGREPLKEESHPTMKEASAQFRQFLRSLDD